MSQVAFNIGNQKYLWSSDSDKESLEKFIINTFIAYCAGEE